MERIRHNPEAGEGGGRGGGFTDDKRRVVEATDLVRLIGEHVALRKKGREFACLCPFHDDHNPSMYVVPHKQIYHCFVCGAGGDAISFVMNFHKASFREALQILADRAGITLSPPPRRGFGGAGTGGSAGGEGGGGGGGGGDDPHGLSDGSGSTAGGGGGPPTNREALLGANRFGQDFFRTILSHPEHGKAARAILSSRGVSPEMIERFGLGASPDRWDGLALTLSNKGLLPRDFLAAGLLKSRESGGGVYDGLRNRITFPIHDALGRVIAFGGRRINDADEPKYLNSPESLLFNKSATLYGLPFAAAAIREKRTVIVTEGYMDCIACHQAGVTNVVATLGTALNTLGARVLRRLGDTIVLLFDGDDAGQRAADRAIEVLFAEPVDVRIATMAAVALEPGESPAKDPDELLKRPRGVERFVAMIACAEDALEHRFKRLGARTSSLGLAARSRAIDDELARLAELGLGRISPVRRHLVIKRVAQLAGVPESLITDVLVRQPKPTAFRPPPGEEAATPIAPPSQRLRTREQLLACILLDPALVDNLSPAEREQLFAATPWNPSALDRVAAIIARLRAEGTLTGVQSVTSALDDPDAVREATRLAVVMSSQVGERTESLAENWTGGLAAFRREAHAAAAPSADPVQHLIHIVNAPKTQTPRPVFPRRS